MTQPAFHLSRRAILSGLAAATAAPALAQRSARFEAAAAYSRARDGVSFLVSQAGRSLAEDWPAPGTPDAAWELASGTKSFSGVLATMLADRRLLSLDERCSQTLTEWQADQARRDITIRQLLTLTSGIDGRGGRRPGQVPSYAEAITATPVAAPGVRFSYGAVPFQIFGEIARRKLVAARLGADPLIFLQRELFDPLSIRPARWRRDRDGMPHLPSGAAFSGRAWAAFGQMVLDGGMAGGRRIVSQEGIAACSRTTPANVGYGLTWWVPQPGMQGPAARPGRGQDMGGMSRSGPVWMAAGAGNQRVYVLPEQRLVIVRQARGVLEALRGGGPDWSDAEFLRLISQDI